MADTVRDLQKAMRDTDTKARSESDPGRLDANGTGVQTPSSAAATALGEKKALEIAVPGGFRRHHVEQQNQKPVSTALRDQIVEKIKDVYNPFIGSYLSQDNDKYDEIEVNERVESLLQTPVFKLPYRRMPDSSKEYVLSITGISVVLYVDSHVLRCIVLYC